MKIVSVVGTRPNFTKEYSMSKALQAKGIEEVLTHTGQHYDYEMSQAFFDGLPLPKPKYINEVLKSGFHGEETATMLCFIEQVLSVEKPDVTLVYGDVNSTVAAALASVKLKIPVAHVEAGIRTPYFYNPEEINRRVTDTMSELLFPNIKSSYDSLISEGRNPDDIVLAGDIVKDSLLMVVKEKQIEVSDKGYLLMTMHRAENTESKKNISSVLKGVSDCGRKIIFLVHPRTFKALEKFSMLDKLSGTSNIDVRKPANYVDFIRLLAGASKVITDSGGVRREAYTFGKPVISISELVWEPEIVGAGWSVTVGSDSEKIRKAILNFEPAGARPPIFGDGKAADRIAHELLRRYSNGKRSKS